MRGNLKSSQIRLLGLLLLFLVTASGVFAYSAAKSHQAIPALSAETALKAIDFAAENDISTDSEFSANLRQSINFNRNRYYSPQTGRFTSKDPIGFNGGYNLYGYAGNNPVVKTDPSGLFINIIAYNNEDPIANSMATKLWRRISFSDTILLPSFIFFNHREMLAEIREWGGIDHIRQLFFIGHGLGEDVFTREQIISLKYQVWEFGGISFPLFGINDVRTLRSSDCHDLRVNANSTFFFGCKTAQFAKEWYSYNKSGNVYGTTTYPVGTIGGSIVDLELQPTINLGPVGPEFEPNNYVWRSYRDVLDYFLKNNLVKKIP